MLFTKAFKSMSVSKQIAYLAVFVALSVAANTILDIDISPTNKIPVTYFVCFFAGYFLGPIPGFAVGLIGDAVGFLIKPVDIYWLYGVTIGLYAFLTSLIMNGIRKEGRVWLQVKAVIALAAGFLVITCLLNTLINYWYAYLFLWGNTFKKGFFVYMVGRLSVQSVVYAVNAVLILIVLPFADRFKRTNRWS